MIAGPPMSRTSRASDSDSQGEPRPGGLLGGEVADAAVRRRLGRGGGGQGRLLSPGRRDMRGGPCPGSPSRPRRILSGGRACPGESGPSAPASGNEPGHRLEAMERHTIVLGYTPTASGRLALERAVQEAKLARVPDPGGALHVGRHKTAFDEVALARRALDEAEARLKAERVPFELRGTGARQDPGPGPGRPRRRGEGRPARDRLPAPHQVGQVLPGQRRPGHPAGGSLPGPAVRPPEGEED